MILTANQIANARVSYFDFFKTMFEAKTNTELVEAPHDREIALGMEKIMTGEIERLLITCPPGYKKTKWTIEFFIPFSLGHFSDSKFITASYSRDLCAEHCVDARNVMELEEYKQIFPDTQIDSKYKRFYDWKTTAGGRVYSAGSAGTITGYRAGMARQKFGGAFIGDDLLKAQDGMYSPIMRETVQNFFFSTVESRKEQSHNPIVVIGHRLHFDDILGVLLRGEDGNKWHHINIPALDENDSSTWEWKYPTEHLKTLRDTARTAKTFMCQYQQEPLPTEGLMLNVEWFGEYKDTPENFTRIIQSWDTAEKDSKLNDPTVCTTWGEKDKYFYLLDVFVKRMNFTDIYREMITLAELYRPHAVLIEEKSTGGALLSQLKDSTDLNVIGITPTVSKIERAAEVSPVIESGRVVLPDSAPWLGEYLLAIQRFPDAGKDEVDSTTQYLKWAARGHINVEGGFY